MKRDIISKMERSGLSHASGINWPIAHFEGGGAAGDGGGAAGDGGSSSGPGGSSGEGGAAAGGAGPGGPGNGAAAGDGASTGDGGSNQYVDQGPSRPSDAVRFALPKPKTPLYTGKSLLEQVQNSNPGMKAGEAQAVALQLYKSGVTDLNATQRYGYADSKIEVTPAIEDPKTGQIIKEATYRAPTAADIRPEYSTDLLTAKGDPVPTSFDLGNHYMASIGVGADGSIKPSVSYQEPDHGFFGNMLRALGPIAPIAIGLIAPELLPALGSFAAPALSAGVGLLAGQDPLKVLEGAGLSYIGGNIGSNVSSGLTDTLGSTGANIVGNIAKQEITSGGKIDPLNALISGGLGAGTSAVLSQVDGFTDLSPALQKSITATVANTLQTGNVDPSKLIGTALSAATSMANEAKAIDPYFQTGAGTGGLPSTDTTPSENIPVLQDNVGALPPTDATIKADYNLFNDTTPSLPEMGGATGAGTGDLPSIPEEPAAPKVSPLTTVGMTPEETASTDWASIYAEPTTNPANGETIAGGDVSQYPNQNFGDSAAGQLENGTINVGPGGFTSGWQTSGSDRIMIQDDGTAIGINENGDSYSLSPEEVSKMVQNGQLNTKESGYVAATGGTGNLPGGSGNVTTPTKTTTPSTPSKPSTPSTPSTTPSAPTTSKTNPFGVLPLDSSAQMLTSTMPTGQIAKMAQLHQLFNSLTPEMRDVFLSKGISPSEPGMTTAATGGLISDETSKILDSLNPKYISSPNLLPSVAPQQQESRLGALRHIGQGPLKGQGLSNRMAQGGLPHKYVEAAPEGHKPEFITGLTGYYAQGGGTGQSDDIPAMLHDGDFVMDADTVASLGDGSSKAGAEVLEKMRKQVPHHDGAGGSPVPAKIADGEYVFPASFVTAIGGGSNKVGAERLNEMREKIRAHKRSAPTTKIPPKAKSPLDYLKMAKG